MKNQRTNFKIGTSLDPHKQYTSSYCQSTRSANHYGRQKLEVGEVKAKLTSVHLGKGNEYGFITNNQRNFSAKNSLKSIVPPNKDFIASIKSHHFDVGPNKPRDAYEMRGAYTSEAKLKYSMKGNAAELRSKLDEAKKADLRTNHFQIGGTTANFKNTTAGLVYRPVSQKLREHCRPSLN